MSVSSRRFLLLIMLVFARPGMAQQQPAPAPAKPQIHEVPAVIEDGGVSVEALYWLTTAQPDLRAGAAAVVTTTADLDFPGKSNPAMGGILSFPAGRGNTVRLEYFRVQGTENTFASRDLTLFGTGFKAGDLLATRYTLQRGKLSWDYLSYTFQGSKVRVKTLWEVQYATIFSSIHAPLTPIEIDSDGLPIPTDGTGSRQVILPTFGIGFEQGPSKHFRWEMKASGFGLPGRARIGDAEAAIALRFGHLEILLGGKGYHFRTSPKKDYFLKSTMFGPYGGVRWYFSSPK